MLNECVFIDTTQVSSKNKTKFQNWTSRQTKWIAENFENNGNSKCRTRSGHGIEKSCFGYCASVDNVNEWIVLQKKNNKEVHLNTLDVPVNAPISWLIIFISKLA